MTLMSTCLGRLGSRASLILDPIRREVHCGALGLGCQTTGQLCIGLANYSGFFQALPLCRTGQSFHCVDQFLTMTSVRYQAQSLELGVQLEVTLRAPFWPRDEKTSLVPAYLVDFHLRRIDAVRWDKVKPEAPRKGLIRFGLALPEAGAAITQEQGCLRYRYRVRARDVFETEGPLVVPGELRDIRRRNPLRGEAVDSIVPLTGKWWMVNRNFEASFDLSGRASEQTCSLALVSWCGDALFERFGQAMPLKYTQWWDSPRAVCEWVREHHGELRRRGQAFDDLVARSPLPPSARNLLATGFQSYLMNTLWCRPATPPAAPKSAGRTRGADRPAPAEPDWFSVWEGTCWFNSTVDVTYNEALFYFACWPELLERVMAEWSRHANDHAGEQRRRARVSDDDRHGNPDVPFPGRVMEHDMGAGWSANGQSYWHAMPVEENSDFLLLLYAHGRWWKRPALFKRYHALCRDLVEYLLWADSTGNGFPDRGVANTIDDATPAVQYGRDNVYLGVKRLAALHAAQRIFEHVGDRAGAKRCAAAVKKAVATFNKGWLGDHYPVCLDKSAAGLVHNRTGEPLPYHVLPGWDAYSLYTTNGLLYLLMVDDLPPGLDADRLRQDVDRATAASMQEYGCGHSSLDRANLWVSMNLWRDCVAAYLGRNMLAHTERYWALQQFANGPGSEKANCFTETSLTNNLVRYPRGAAAFGLLLALPRVRIHRKTHKRTTDPLPIPGDGVWPELPLKA